MKASFLISLFFLANTHIMANEVQDIRFPTKLVCQTAGNPNSEVAVLYTRLAPLTSSKRLSKTPTLVWYSEGVNAEKPRPDEVAWNWLGSYYEARITDSEFQYNLWTCDTEDRFYTFSTKDLMIPFSSNVKERNVSGNVSIEVRGDKESFNLNCVATY